MKREVLGELAVELARRYKGKIATYPSVPVKRLQDFSVWYTPGVAEVSRRIAGDPEASFELTGRWNTIAIVTDGTRVLGLGDIGPVAALPVMEGKALLFRYLGGVNAVPLPVALRGLEELEAFVRALAPAVGGVNLEDIESPKCFALLDRLRGSLDIPVWHDDQQGTAGAVLAALYGALRLVGKRLGEVSIAMIGAGAANVATLRLLIAAGADPSRIYVVDSKGILGKGRPDLERLRRENPYKYWVATTTNGEGRSGGIPEAMRGADVVIAASRPRPGLIRPEWIRLMADKPIVFALANPDPEIWPSDALEAGAAVVATGRSDFPNQVNNSLVFPGVFRGTLDSRAKTITDGMVIAAARELARYVEEHGLSRDYIIPRMSDWDVYPRVAAAVAEKAAEEGVARKPLSREEELRTAEEVIGTARRGLEALMEAGIVADAPELERLAAELR